MDSHPRKDPCHIRSVPPIWFLFFSRVTDAGGSCNNGGERFGSGFFFVSPLKRQGFTRLGEEGWHGWHSLQTPPNVPWWEQKHPGSCRQLGAEISRIEHKPVCEAFARESGGFGEGRNLLKKSRLLGSFVQIPEMFEMSRSKDVLQAKTFNTTVNEYYLNLVQKLMTIFFLPHWPAGNLPGERLVTGTSGLWLSRGRK